MDGNSMQNTMTSTTSTVYSHPYTTPTRKKLIVEEQAKIERELDNSQKEYSNRPSKWVVGIKWISTVILGALLLGCVTLSKVSVIALSYRMNTANVSQSGTPTPPPGTTNPEIRYMCQLFVMLLIIILVPYVVCFIRGLFAGLFRDDIPWPSYKGFILATVLSLLESVGISLFAFKLPDLATDHPYLLVPVMHSVFLIPAVTYVFDSLRNPQNNGTGRTIIFVMALILELAGAGSIYLLYNEKKSLKLMFYAIAAILCLSIAWSPLLQRSLINISSGDLDSSENSNKWRSDIDQTEVSIFYTTSESGQAATGGSSTYQSYQSQVISGHSQFTESYKLRKIANKRLEQEIGVSMETKTDDKVMPSTWKLTIYMSFLKIVFTVTIAMMLFHLDFFESNFSTDLKWDYFKEGWKWSNINRSKQNYELYYFVANIAASGVGYIVGYIACTTCMQRGAFIVPLICSTPLSVVLLTQMCDLYIPVATTGKPPDVCTVNEPWWLIGTLVCLCLGQILCSAWLLFRSQFIVLLKEVQLFWTPMYNSVLLEQWLTLVRKNQVNDNDYENPQDAIKKSKVVICTTMYREADYEMKQLLESIQKINKAQSEGQRSFEAHVFFDGAVKDKRPQEFVLQLVSLAETTLGVKAGKSTKIMTPYGMTLTWSLENGTGKRTMLFVVHLKDNYKVKNKKRWSQVMYMSYVMDYLMGISDKTSETDTYILTTDADVRFTPDSVEALLDLMTRDHSVGAVCARTHPLGSGPLVWYQIFEYAIGHWFQKAAEHVIGSVLCSPGCFSVYRCKALRDILPRYASNVEHAFDFLTMDMGEDRWLCTLMVQSGWRIEYCAAAENSTHCPEQFDEFYKQRRRWVASTLANIMLLLKEWSTVSKLNHRVSFIFLIYQAILLFATLIGPSSVVLVVSGGLVFGWGINSITTVVIQVLVIVGLTAICLLCSSKTQLNACKFVTFVYAIVMTSVVVGTAVQMIQGEGITDAVNISTTTLYLAMMASVFLITGMLHLREFVYLLHGIWFLLCLPSGYLVLIIYSVCNITDRSWGTRELKVKSVTSRGRTWQENLRHYFKQIFFCCFKQEKETVTVDVQTDPQKKRTNSNDLDGSFCTIDMRRSISSQNSVPNDERLPSMSVISEGQEKVTDPDGTDDSDDDSDLDEGPVDVDDWLPSDMKGYAKNFRDAGFDNTMFITGMTEKELKDIGIKKKGIRRKLMEDIRVLPDFEIQADVPEHVDKWLKSIGLSQYSKVFKREQIKTSKDMEILKSFGRSELERELKIKKPGHIKRLLYAIGKLRNPTERERKLTEVRKSIEGVQENFLYSVNPEENEFWEELRNKCLLPQSTVFGSEEELKGKLGDLRNAWLMVFAVSNTLWLILIETLASKGELLATYGSNPVGLLVLALFSAVLLVQFLAMIVHRVATLTHFLARAPYRPGDTFNTRWAFNEKDLKSHLSSDDIEAIKARDKAIQDAEVRLKPKPKRRSTTREDKRPLVTAHSSTSF